MKRKRCSDEQIACAPRRAESGTAVEEVCRRLGVLEPTFRRWEAVCGPGGMTWVVEALDDLVQVRGRPKSLRVDNGPEFAGRALDQWACLNGVELDFSRPGKPADTAPIEAFGRLRAEGLNASWFLCMAGARNRIERWRKEYNDERPPSALGALTPPAHADQTHFARTLA